MRKVMVALSVIESLLFVAALFCGLVAFLIGYHAPGASTAFFGLLLLMVYLALFRCAAWLERIATNAASPLVPSRTSRPGSPPAAE